MDPIRKELSYGSFAELQKADTLDLKKVNYNRRPICTSLLKMYDEGISLFKLGDDERAYMLLMRFFGSYQLLRTSKLYKEDRTYVDSLIDMKKATKTLQILEGIKESLVKRYKERAENEEAKKKLAEAEKIKEITASIAKVPGMGSLPPSENKFLTPTELKAQIFDTNYKFLVIDIRTKAEFDFSHINLNILLSGMDKKQNLIHYMNFPHDIIENVAWKLEESIKKFDAEHSNTSSKLFCARHEYDYIVLLDRDSKSNLLKPDSKLLVFKKAIYEFDQSTKLKNEPIILDGGWNQWVTYFPGFRSSTSSNGIPAEVEAVSKSADSGFKNILNFSYPEIIAPTKEVKQEVKTPAKEEIPKAISLIPNAKTDIEIKQEEQKKSNIVSIPIVNRSIKPTTSDKRIIQPEAQAPKPKEINGNQITLPKFQPPNKQNPAAFNPTVPTQQLTFKPPQSPSTTHSSLPKIQPPVLPSPAAVSDDTDIYSSVYRPNIRLNPIQMNGNKKVVDPVTGIYRIYSDAPQNRSQASKPTVLPEPTRTNTNGFDKPVFVSHDKKPTSFLETDKENRNPTDYKPKSNLKRTMSIPNITSLDKDTSMANLMSDASSSDSENEDEQKSVAQTTGTSHKSQEPIKVLPKRVEEPSSRHVPNLIAKPDINRKAKPMVDDGKMHLRIQELDPVYANQKPGFCGITNLGNTCFMNCIIQCLNSSKYLVDFFLKNHYRQDLNRTNALGFRGEIAEEYAVIVSAIWSGHCKVIKPRRFKSIIGQFNEQFLSNEQQDSQEFLLFLMDGLHEDLNRIQKRPRITNNEDENDKLSDEEASTKAWKIHLSMNNSIIVDLFQGQFKSSITCNTCNKQSIKFDAFMYLTLPILSSKCDIYQCLKLFLQAENMVGECKWKCPRCNAYRDAKKKIDIWKLPHYLIIHLKRFKYQGIWRDKINTYVDFPIEDLKLGSFIPSNSKRDPLNYQLFGISNHIGNMDGGHYTAFCRHLDNNRWYKYDDQDVREIQDKSTLKSSSSYILFYSMV